MKLAILLWVYKDVPLSQDRARWLRRLNPGTPVSCLYCGPLEDAGRFAAALAPLIDDFYAIEEPCSAHDKWLRADRLLAAWHRDRGRRLHWGTIFVAQWDLVLLAPVATLCGSLAPGEVLFSSTRPVAEVRRFWHWLRPGSADARDYAAFQAAMERGGGFPAEPLCCNLIAAALPRAYLDRYAEEAPELGFSEYKMTILAQVWRFPFCLDHRLDAAWVQERPLSRWRRHFVAMHGEGVPVHRKVLALHALWPWGRRAFHPYAEAVPRWLALLPAVRRGGRAAPSGDHHQASGRAANAARSSIASAASSTACSSSGRPMT